MQILNLWRHKTLANIGHIEGDDQIQSEIDINNCNPDNEQNQSKEDEILETEIESFSQVKLIIDNEVN